MQRDFIPAAHGERSASVSGHSLKLLLFEHTGNLKLFRINIARLAIRSEILTYSCSMWFRKRYQVSGKSREKLYSQAESSEDSWHMLNGKQYIVIAISGGGYSAELLAFRLPN